MAQVVKVEIVTLEQLEHREFKFCRVLRRYCRIKGLQEFVLWGQFNLPTSSLFVFGRHDGLIASDLGTICVCVLNYLPLNQLLENADIVGLGGLDSEDLCSIIFEKHSWARDSVSNEAGM